MACALLRWQRTTLATVPTRAHLSAGSPLGAARSLTGPPKVCSGEFQAFLHASAQNFVNAACREEGQIRAAPELADLGEKVRSWVCLRLFLPFWSSVARVRFSASARIWIVGNRIYTLREEALQLSYSARGLARPLQHDLSRARSDLPRTEEHRAAEVLRFCLTFVWTVLVRVRGRSWLAGWTRLLTRLVRKLGGSPCLQVRRPRGG